jgi:hypothetical protein
MTATSSTVAVSARSRVPTAPANKADMQFADGNRQQSRRSVGQFRIPKAVIRSHIKAMAHLLVIPEMLI